MNAALELFANEGYHSTSISNIAIKAGVSKGLMYNYFESKEELIKAIIDDGLDIIQNLFDPDKDGSLTEQEFDYFVDQTFNILKKNLNYWKLYFSIMMQPTVFDLVKERYKELVTESLKLLVEYYIRQGVEDPEHEAILFGAMMDGISMNYVLNPELFPFEQLKIKIIERFSHKN